MRKLIRIALPCLLVFAAVIFAGCALLDAATQAGTTIGVATGTITPGQAESINKSSAALGKAFHTFTPEEEYYLGRAAAAVLFKTYRPYDGPAGNNYLNVMGQTIAQFSDKPSTFGGYRFMILNTDEINAFAAPGGLILVSKGLLRCCKSEDEIAAVLAHEIAHVQHGHAIGVIGKGRMSSAVSTLLIEAGKQYGPAELAEVLGAFEGSISDMVNTLLNKGYAPSQETEADKSAVTILARMGYNPTGLKNMLQEMNRIMPHDKKGFDKTHPPPNVRIKDIEPLLAGFGPINSPAKRTERFKAALASVQ